MTEPPPFRARAGAGTDIGIADAATAWRTLGGDDAQAAAIARCLGFDLTAPRAPVRDAAAARTAAAAAAPTPAPTPAPRPAAPTPRPAPARPPTAPPVRPPRAPDPWRQLRPTGYAVRDATGDDDDSVIPLPVEEPQRPLPPIETLIPAGIAPQLIESAVATDAGDGALVLDALVDAIARRAGVDELPRAPRTSLFRGVQLLVDRGPAMAYFHQDVEALTAVVGAVVGDALVQRVSFDGSPLLGAGTGPVWQWGDDYRPPPPGTPVVAFTDAGLAAASGSRASAGVAVWAALARRLARQRSRLILFLPYPRRRWPAGITETATVLEWDRASRLGRSGAPAAGGDPEVEALTGVDATRWRHTPPGARLLAEYAALAVRVQPPLLRGLRRAVAAHLDAGDEADLWWSPIVGVRTSDAVTVAPGIARFLQRRLRERHRTDPAAVAAARAVVAELHAGEPPVLRLEEDLIWAVVTGADPAALDATLAGAWHGLARQRRDGLADWWYAAWRRLPDEARDSSTAARLSLMSSAVLGEPVMGVPQQHALPEIALDADLAVALRQTGDVPLGVLRDGPLLLLGDVDRARGYAVPVPATVPLVVQVAPAGGTALTVTVPDGAVVTATVGTGRVTLRTARGLEYDLPTAPDLSPQQDEGSPYPLGASYDGVGVNVAVFAGEADRVLLCLFDAEDTERQIERQIDLRTVHKGVWHAYLPGLEPGQRYGYRVDGPRHNPHKLLLDPYAKAIDGDVSWDPAVYGHDLDDPTRPSTSDSAPFVPKSVVVNPYFDWAGDRPPRIPLADTVIYEAHVRGLTMRHPAVPAELRGTYAAIGHPAVVDHLRRLGITAVQLLPVQHFVHEQRLVESGLANAWGYSPIGHLAPYHGYAASGALSQQVQEFRAMVRALHAAGIEVILDVVFASTGEGDPSGPTLSFRGLDNAHYYRSDGGFNVRNPHALQLVLDSLRYWVTEMHVDGFRFDRTSALVREDGVLDRLATFFQALHQDPVLSEVKLIAHPSAEDQGRFPPQWSEQNTLFRDAVRDFWRGEPGALGEFAARIIGSADLFGDSGRRPQASVNLITSHDGFTLTDLVSYNDRHNEANGHDNTDGEPDNHSWNCGVEGPTDDPAVNELRDRQRRNLLATLMLSQGVPMLRAGDELGHTQQGNNHAYCQDKLTWLDWNDADQSLLAFTRELIALRKRHPALRRDRYLTGRPVRRGSGPPVPDIAWLADDGEPMTDVAWEHAMTVGMVLDDGLLLIVNATGREVRFTIPGDGWQLVLSTAAGVDAGRVLRMPDRSLMLLSRAG